MPPFCLPCWPSKACNRCWAGAATNKPQRALPRRRRAGSVTRLIAAVVLGAALLGAKPCRAQRPALLEAVAELEPRAWQTALRIWDWAEPGYQERRSAAALADWLQEAGFRVQRGVAGIPTAFTASFGEGAPVIGILAEYDALPGLSQEAVPHRQPRPEGGGGHGCGHHLFGAASTCAAICVADQLRSAALRGTVRLYGCPAEEGGGAKAFMAREGLFDDCAAVLHWHAGSRNAAGDVTSMARISAKYRFYGKAAHAAGSPHEGRSALDAVELTNHAAQLLREHTPEGTRIHHVITAGGDAPNVVPEFAEVYYYVRHADAGVARSVYRRLELCAQAGALATETRLEIDYQGGTVDLLPNSALSQVVLRNLRELADTSYTDEERAFAARIQQTLDDPQPLDTVGQVYDQSGLAIKGSTDVGDVSWKVPTAGFNTACWVPGTPGHSWQACAAGGMSIGRKGMKLAARVLAASAWDLLNAPQTLEAAKAEHQRRLAGRQYQPLMRPDQKPPLDYRNPPRAQRGQSGGGP